MKKQSCSHPMNQRTTIGVGIFCKLCKKRVGFLSAEEFKASMERYLDDFAYAKDQNLRK